MYIYIYIYACINIHIASLAGPAGLGQLAARVPIQQLGLVRDGLPTPLLYYMIVIIMLCYIIL